MAPTIEKHEAAEQGRLLPKIKALVVHEDPSLLFYYEHVLEDLGLEVLTVTTYAAGLGSLDRDIPGFILVSQGNRAFEGRCVLEHALEKNRRTPVLVVARCRDLGNYLEAMQLGAVDYLEEPLTVAEIGRVVTTHLHAAGSGT